MIKIFWYSPRLGSHVASVLRSKTTITLEGAMDTTKLRKGVLLMCSKKVCYTNKRRTANTYTAHTQILISIIKFKKGKYKK